MDARSNSSAIDISISLEDYTCPITQELFFEPVLAMPCGHAFEEKASGGLVKDACPSCRTEILMFGPALDKKRELDKALQANPELYPKVYFNLDHFAEIVSKKRF